MLTVICGENVVESRDYFNNLKKSYQKQGWHVENILPEKLITLSTDQATSPSLFAQKIIYATDHLLKKIKKDKQLPRVEIIDWEEDPSFRLKFPKGTLIKEFKPPLSIFKLLDACYPGNLKQFLNILHQLPEKMEEGFIFRMLTERIRNLILIKEKQKLPKLQLWQKNKLIIQSKYWRLESLLAFYEGLYRIEVATKTSNNPFSIRKSLDILSTYFL